MTMRPVAALPTCAIAFWIVCHSSREKGVLASPINWPWAIVARALLVFFAGCFVPLTGFCAFSKTVKTSRIVMDPGPVVFEGMNPGTTPCGSAPPLIVYDIQTPLAQPDAIHLAYRIVAFAAMGKQADSLESNRFWLDKSLAFVAAYPRAAARYVLLKMQAWVSNYDVYDLMTMYRTAQDLSRYPWLPFGILLGLALVGLWLGRTISGFGAAWLYVVSYSIVPILFYVSARQRNPLMPGLIILAAMGLVGIKRELSLKHNFRVSLAAAIAVLTAMAASVNGTPQIENDHGWIVFENSQRLILASDRARGAGDTNRAAMLLAEAASWSGISPGSVPDWLIRDVSLSALAEASVPERRFDLAMALAGVGEWRIAAQVFNELEQVHYRPWRGNSTTNSVAFHHARALLHLQIRPELVVEWMRAATEEAPGDAVLLALRSCVLDKMGEHDEARLLDGILFRLHDPFTADLARAQALDEIGDTANALSLLHSLKKRFPLWSRSDN